MKDITEALNKWRKDSTLSNLTYRFHAVSARIPAGCFVDIDKVIIRFLQRGRRHRTTNTILKEDKVGGIILSEFQDSL